MLKELNVTMCGKEFSKWLREDFLGLSQLEVSSPPKFQAWLYHCTFEPLPIISYLSVSIFTSYLAPKNGKNFFMVDAWDGAWHIPHPIVEEGKRSG